VAAIRRSPWHRPGALRRRRHERTYRGCRDRLGASGL